MFETYIREREGKKTFTTEYGFVTYRVHEKEIYLADMFIKREFRNPVRARELVNHVFALARLMGVPSVTTTVNVGQKGCEDYVKLNLHFGFKIIGLANADILFSKDVGPLREV